MSKLEMKANDIESPNMWDCIMMGQFQPPITAKKVRTPQLRAKHYYGTRRR